MIARPVTAGPQPQVVYQTPTAQPDGRVIYIVQEGDSCLRIQLLTGVTVDTLRELNRLDQSCTINPNQELLLAVIQPEATPTPNPDITSTPPLPTPTQMVGTGEICVLLFHDVNGNAVHDSVEVSMTGGAVSISNRSGSVSQTANTSDAIDPVCMEVPEGEYTISMAIPSGYNATTLLTQVLRVEAGETAILEFGAQVSTRVDAEGAQNVPAASTPNNIPLAVMGGIFVLLGVGLGVYILFTRGK